MNKFRFWLAVVLACVLGLTGFILGEVLPPIDSYSPEKLRLLYAFLGALIGLLTYARVATWLVQTFTRLTSQAVSRLAVEIINQFSNLTSKRPIFPINLEQNSDLDSIIKGNLEGYEGVIILDTSSIIDGRVLDVARTGFVTGMVVVPGFVLRELQQVADSGNNLKRARGRRGFEIINQLRRVRGLTLQVWDEKSNLFSKMAGRGVDDKLVYLGKALKGRILTCDFNLSKVAKLSGVDVLNLNDLTNSLKTLPLPGEKLVVKILHVGKDKDQGVGYLSDGVMVVVKGGASLVGTETEIEATKIIQGPSGRMVFGRKTE